MTCAFVIFAASSDSSHLQADCLESGISSGPLPSITSMGTFTFSGSLGIVRAYLLIWCMSLHEKCLQHQRSQFFVLQDFAKLDKQVIKLK